MCLHPKQGNPGTLPRLEASWQSGDQIRSAGVFPVGETAACGKTTLAALALTHLSMSHRETLAAQTLARGLLRLGQLLTV